MAVDQFATLGPEIKMFILVVSIAGPLSIILLLILIRSIQLKDPERIRWR